MVQRLAFTKVREQFRSGARNPAIEYRCAGFWTEAVRRDIRPVARGAQVARLRRHWRTGLATIHRRWPSGKPRMRAFCRSAPTVRFIAFAIFLTGDLLRECTLSSRTSAFDHGRRLVRRTRLVAIVRSRRPYARHLQVAE